MTSWRGDVAAGVDAWTRRGAPAPPAEDKVAKGLDADPEAAARKILLDQLTGRARSRSELADKLASKDIPEDVASRLLDRFTDVGLIDDAAFARLWVEGRQRGKGLAPRALAQELRRKGIDDDTARAALDEVTAEDQDTAARMLVRHKLRTVRNLEPAVATRRLVAMLGRKGYAPGLSYRVVKAELSADAGSRVTTRLRPMADDMSGIALWEDEGALPDGEDHCRSRSSCPEVPARWV